MTEAPGVSAHGKPVIIVSAPNGARRGKQDHPALPLTPPDIAACAESVVEAGASVLHLHVRDAEGRHTLDAVAYRTAIAAVRERLGDRVVIQVTSEACGMYSREQQMAVVRELRPEAVSLALRELCPDAASESEAAAFFALLSANAIHAQYILYSPEEAARFENLWRRGIIADEHPFVLFVLGRYSRELAGDPADLELFFAALGEQVEWSVCCFGSREHEAAHRAMLHGGHVRVGFENNLQMPDGSLARDNAELVRLVAVDAATLRRPLASAHDVRERFA
jgi:3-keto-5-aminohexanoate cleavage enzyme